MRLSGEGEPTWWGSGRMACGIALSQGGSFAPPQFASAEFGYNQGWRVDSHVRTLV